MSILFYDHLVDRQPIEEKLATLGVDIHQKSRLQHLIDEVIHQGVLEFILQKLHPHYHHEFLTRMERVPHDKTLLTFLEKNASQSIEVELQEHSRHLVAVIVEDLEVKLEK